MKPLEVVHVAGARPNFVKLAPLMRAMATRPEAIVQRWVHTGQHYDRTLSSIVREQLELPPPHVHLGVGAAPRPVQVARIAERFAAVLERARPDWVFVFGDVTSTVAAAEASARAGVPVAHVEAGLRSFDDSMPEERNRVRTDRVAELLFTPSEDADANLRREGFPEGRIVRVGNVMIDTLLGARRRAERALRRLSEAGSAWLGGLGIFDGAPRPFALATLHRPSNVDRPAVLEQVLEALGQLASRLPIVFPVHPRTRRQLDALPRGAGRWPKDLLLLEPLPYLEFIALERRAAMVLTDSGGVQEETTALGVPCLTLRPCTERPITLRLGTNRLVEPRTAAILEAAEQLLATPARPARVPELWDGHAAERIVEFFATSQR